MKTNRLNYDRRVKRIQKTMNDIEAQYPTVDFHDSLLRREMIHYGQLMNELIYAKVNADYCESNDPNQMCETCTCWKKARAISS